MPLAAMPSIMSSINAPASEASIIVKVLDSWRVTKLLEGTGSFISYEFKMRKQKVAGVHMTMLSPMLALRAVALAKHPQMVVLEGGLQVRDTCDR